MNLGSMFISIIILVLVGGLGGYFYSKSHSKDFFGGQKAGICVGIVGGILGGFIFDFIFRIPIFKQLVNIPYVKNLLVNQFDINFITTGLGVWLFLLLYNYVSNHTERS